MGVVDMIALSRKQTAEEAAIAAAQPTTETIHHIPVPLIVPSRWQPRQAFDPEYILELARSIKIDGLMYPVILFRNEDLLYELVAGECRTRAIVAIGLTQSPTWCVEHGNGLRKATAHVAEHGWVELADDIKKDLVTTTIDARLEADDDRARLHKLAVIDNIRRANLTPLEEARAFQGLMQEQQLSQRALAAELGCSQSKVQERLSLLNLSAEARQALTARAVSASHARHLAKLPQEIQPAVTEHVQQLVDREGDQAATVRQIAVLTQQIRAFLNPDHWLPPQDKTITPVTRNNLRLVRAALEDADITAAGEAIVSLRQVGYSKENMLGKKPINLRGGHLEPILAALSGTKKQSIVESWFRFAGRHGWSCSHCQLAGLQAPSTNVFHCPCPKWRDADFGHGTCRGFIGQDDPLILEVEPELCGWAERLGFDDLVIEPFPHFTKHHTWHSLVEQASAAKEEQQRKAQEKRETAYIHDIQAFCEWQLGMWAPMQHFQAHKCDRCLHRQPDLLERDLPPCKFVAEPLTQDWSETPRAPHFGVLVRGDGLMLPRCEQFRYEPTALDGLGITPTNGFILPDRDVTVEWLHRILINGGNRTTHDYTICGPLVWLSYPRKHGDVHSLDALLRYIKRVWDDLGDERVATLLTTGASEIAAIGNYHQPFNLFDPTTLQVEAWACQTWETVRDGKDHSRYGSHYPPDWPKPWIRTG